MNRAGQIELVINTNGSNKAPVPNAQCSDQNLTLTTVLISRLIEYGERGLLRVDMLIFRPAKILDKRPCHSGDGYKCELEPPWLATGLVEKAPMRRDHIQTY